MRLNNLPNVAQARGCQGWTRRRLRLFFLFCFTFRKATTGERLKLLAQSDHVKSPHIQTAARNWGCTPSQRVLRGCGINQLYHYHLPIPPDCPKGEEQSLSHGLMLFPPQGLLGGAPRESFKKLGAPVGGEVWYFHYGLEACLSSILPELLLGLPRTEWG